MKLRDLFNTLTDKMLDYEGSCNLAKRFSDVVDFIHSKKSYGRSIAGRVLEETDNGLTYVHRYSCSGQEFNDEFDNIRFEIRHVGDKVVSINIRIHSSTPETDFNKIVTAIKELPDYVDDNIATVKSTAVENYDSISLREIGKIFDEKLACFGVNSDALNFGEVKAVYDAFIKRIESLNATQTVASDISNINLYISSITTQLSNPVTAGMIGQFVGTYIPQIKISIQNIVNIVKE